MLTAFYQSLVDGHTPEQALRQAQLTLQRQPELAHPYFWAGFILMGAQGNAS